MRIDEGDVFLIPITSERVAVGQIVHRYGQRGKTPWYMVVYDGIYPREPAPDLGRIVTLPIRLQGKTFDPLIRMGRWPLVGRAPVPTDRIVWPLFKIMTNLPNTYAVIDHTMKFVRHASRHDVENLSMMTSVGPIRLEHAAQALAGLGPWAPEYDVLLPPDIGERARGPLGRLLG